MVVMVQQENKRYYLNKKDIIDRKKNNSFLLAICPKCGNEFEIGKQFYAMYLAKYCPYCNTLISFNK